MPDRGGAGDLDSTLRVGGDEINRNRRRRKGERILIRFRAESLGLQKEERKVGMIGSSFSIRSWIQPCTQFSNVTKNTILVSRCEDIHRDG